MPSLPPFGRRRSNQPPIEATISATEIAEDATQGTAIGTITPTDVDQFDVNEGRWRFEIAANTKFQLSREYGPTSELQRSGTGTLTGGQNENVLVRITDRRGGIFEKTFVVTPLTGAGGSDVAPDIGPATFNITTAYADNDPVGFAPLLNTPSPAASFSITAGNAGGQFAISSSTGQITVASSAALTVTTYSLTVQATNAAGSDTATISVQVAAPGSEALITTITLTNRSASTKTNEIMELGLPLSATAMTGFTTVALYDDDGFGAKGSLLGNFQVSQSAADMNSKRRFCKISGAIPSLDGTGGSLPTRILHCYASTSAEPTGTAITATDVLATAAFDNGGFKATFGIGGVSYSVTAEDMLGGSTTYSKTGLWLAADKIEEGPFCTGWRLRAAPRNAGTGHNSGDGVHVEMHLYAYKAQTGAVTGGNPITAFKCRMFPQNGDAARATHVGYYYDSFVFERATSIADGTLISTDDTDPLTNQTVRYSYTGGGVQPAADLTLSSDTSSSVVVVTRSAGAWAADVLGSHIVGTTGRGHVVRRVSDTQIHLRQYAAFGGGLTVASGDWTLYVLAHGSHTQDTLVAWVGNKPTSVAIWGTHSSAVTPTTKGGLDYLISTKMVPNYGLTFAEISHTTPIGYLDQMKGDGSIKPFTLHCGNGTASAANSGIYRMGEVQPGIGGVGGRPDIGLIAGWGVYGLVKYDDDGRRRIFENARYFSSWDRLAPPRLSGSPAAGQLPNHPRADDGTNYGWANSNVNVSKQPTPTWVPWSGATSHHPNCFYVPYLLTGDYYWLQCQQRLTEYSCWMEAAPAYNGSGINRTAFGDATLATVANPLGNLDTRQKSWGSRDEYEAAAITPDTAKESLYTSKTYRQTRLAKLYAAGKGWGPDDAGSIYGTNEPIWFKYGTGSQAFAKDGTNSWSFSTDSPWAMLMGLISIQHARQIGSVNADGDAFRTWLNRLVLDLWNNANVIPEMIQTPYRWMIKDNDGYAALPTSWVDLFNRSRLRGTCNTADLAPSWSRTPTGTLTLSDNAVGTGKMFTFSGSYFGSGLSGYQDGYIVEWSGSTVVGLAKITGVTSATVVTCEILKAFSASPTLSNIRIPGPTVADYDGYKDAVVNAEYGSFFAASAALIADEVGAAGTNAYNWMTGRANFAWSYPQHYILPP